ncbi:Gustatory and pheromone receptor 32a [Frankliniella fusca]|uniref:Gustatory and pheromone receptor 32a n=1 Tax=Frankliniella fusca TaxID=407009 RepID=A0AAE1HJV3_9NEOP|nr:Gustatory and pheromone receptor 32a [Frankliniella fusca]
MVGFLHQIQMQEIRFGAFNLNYFDLRTMNAVLASVFSYLVVLAQFSLILKNHC